MTLGPTLTDAKGLGGIIAADGFDYQTWNALVRIPAWLTLPNFDGFIMEGLEDFEARYFAPLAKGTHLLDRYQAKSAELSPAAIVTLFEGFKEFDDLHPGTVRSHTLVTPGLPAGMQLLERNQGRVKRARTFYRPFAGMLAASEAQLLEQYRGKFGDNALHHVGAVDVELSPNHGRDQAEIAFAHALDQAFPTLELAPRVFKRVFAALLERVNTARGRLITRPELLALMREAGVALTEEGALPVRLRGADDADDLRVLDIDCSAFSGDGGFPTPDHYAAGLLAPLVKTSAWARAQHRQRVLLSGRYRISTAIAAGWAFRSAIGFELDVPTKDGVWSSNAHPAGAGTSLAWQVNADATVVDGRLAVGVGILRDVVPAMLKSGHPGMPLRLFLDEAVPDAQRAQEAVREIKRHVDRAVAALHPAAVDLYFAGPAAVAALLGHRWNGLLPTRLHELHTSSGTYVPTAMIE